MTARQAVVTGGAKGIGRAISLALARDGFDVVALGRDDTALGEVVAESKKLQGTVTSGRVDLTDVKALHTVLSALEPIDVLVNNAGASASGPVERTSLDDWNHLLRLNATAPFVAIKAVLPGMRERGWGRIVTIASTASHRSTRYVAAYAASKHAVLGLMRAVAAEVAGTGVTANCVSPSFARTEMTERSVATIVSRTGRSPADAEAALMGASPLGRLVEPEEVAAAVSYLVSEAAGAVNGQSIALDGGGLQL